jgi:integrase
LPRKSGPNIFKMVVSRRDKIWSLDDELSFLEKAPRHLHLALQLGLWTGQRQGDLLKLPWTAYDGKTIRLKQSKTGFRVVIPVGSPLKTALDTAKKRSTIILQNRDGKPWTADGFRSSWRKACRAASIVGVTFNDLRGTAVTRLALAGCTEAEIATITGPHAERRKVNSRCQLPSSRPGAGRGRNQEARSENKNSRPGSRLCLDVPRGKRGKRNEISWLGD